MGVAVLIGGYMSPLVIKNFGYTECYLMYAACSIVSIVFLLLAMYFEYKEKELNKGGYTR